MQPVLIMYMQESNTRRDAVRYTSNSRPTRHQSRFFYYVCFSKMSAGLFTVLGSFLTVGHFYVVNFL